MPPELIKCPICERSQAALKLRRAIGCGNPTPAMPQDCWEKLHEEWADTCLCIDVIPELRKEPPTKGNYMYKARRWVARLEAAKVSNEEEEKTE